jgi:hypothetical protein
VESRGDPGFCCFAGIFEGILGKGGGGAWLFAGELVVICVVGMVASGCVFGKGKYASFLMNFCGYF